MGGGYTIRFVDADEKSILFVKFNSEESYLPAGTCDGDTYTVAIDVVLSTKSPFKAKFVGAIK